MEYARKLIKKSSHHLNSNPEDRSSLGAVKGKGKQLTLDYLTPIQSPDYSTPSYQSKHYKNYLKELKLRTP